MSKTDTAKWKLKVQSLKLNSTHSTVNLLNYISPTDTQMSGSGRKKKKTQSKKQRTEFKDYVIKLQVFDNSE